MSANKTIKVPDQLTRAATLTMQGEGEQRQATISISSDTPYLRYDWWSDEEYWEVLDHSPGGFVADRLKAGLPGLYNHKRDFHLSRARSWSCDGHRIEVSDLVWSTSDDAQQKKSDHDAGVLVDTSVGYSLLGDGECVGAKDGIPIYRFKWEPHEFSLVTIPADITVGAGRQREKKPEGTPREISIKNSVDGLPVNPHNAETTPPMKLNPLAATHFRNKDESGGGTTAPVIDAANERKQAIAEFKGRCKKIDDHVAAIRSDKWREIVSVVANKHKEGEADYEAFRTEANNAIDAYTSAQTESRGDAASGITVVGERGGQRQQGNERSSIGEAFVRSKGFSEMQSRSGQGAKNFGMDFQGLHCLGGRGKAALATRAGWVSSDLSSINVAPMQSLGNTQLGVQRTTVLDLLTPGTTDKTAIPYPVESSLGSINGTAVTSGSMPRVGTTAEGGTKPRWTPDLTTATAYVSKIAALATIPEEMLTDFSAIQSYVDGRLPYMVDIEAEFQVLYGDGLGTNIRGILSTSGIQSRAYATDWQTTIKKAITDIRVNSFFEPDGIVMHPYDWEMASLEKDLNGQFLAGGPFYAPYGAGVYVERYTYCGLPVAVTTSCTVTRPVVGAFKLGAQYFMREGMRVESTNSNKDDFERNMVTLRAEERLALAVYRPISFIEITGGVART